MKRLFMSLIMAFGFMAVAAVGYSQEPAKKPAGTLSKEVCAAVEKYVAGVDASRAIRDKSGREENYDRAKSQLEATLRANNRMDLLDGIVMYSVLAETEFAADPTDRKLSQTIDKRLKLRSSLLELCSDYTITR